MLKTNFLFATVLCAGAFLACQQTSTPPVPNAASVTVTMTKVRKEKCIRDSVCATLDLSYPVLTGGANAATTKSINDSILAFVYLATEADPAWPQPEVFDSAAQKMFVMLQEDAAIRGTDGIQMSFSNELKSKVVWQTNKYLSLEMDTWSFSGGAHGMYGTLLETFDLNTGKPLLLTDIVKDTTALRPLLEKGFVEAKKVDAPDMAKMTLADFLLSEFKQLPMPVIYCIVPEGLRFVYNPYEVAPYAVGQTDILLTWAQLGGLADKGKWE